MKHLVLSVLAVALLAPTAIAQEQARIDDAELDAFPPAANAWADLTGASMEISEGAIIRVHVSLGALPEIQPGAVYCVVFSDGLTDIFGCLAATPTVNYLYGTWEDGSPDRASDTQGTYTAGVDGVVSVDIPVSALRANATELTALRAFSLDDKRGAAPFETIEMLLLDEAAGDATLRLPAREAPAAASANAAEAPSAAPAAEGAAREPPPAAARSTVPSAGALLGLAVMGAVALVARRRRA